MDSSSAPSKRRILCLIFAVVLVSSGCQCARAAQCAAANGDRERCQEMREDCNAVGGPVCRGDCPGSCGLSEDQRRCTLRSDWRSRCPSDTRIFSGGRVGDLAPFTLTTVSPSLK